MDPWFVLPGLTFSFLIFNLIAFNRILQYSVTGKWQDNVFGDKSYVWLSLINKSTLAWLLILGIVLA